ncbi:MAG: ATP-binding protein [Alphaproteobacteria bacterium]
MAEATLLSVDVRERSQVAEARRRAYDMAHRVGLGDAEAARAALVATEAATNLVKYGREGEMLVAPCADAMAPSVTIAAVDRGPGIANPAECIEDGFSTGEGPGLGLGTIRRQSDRFDIFSVPGEGTAVVATIRRRDAAEPHSVDLVAEFGAFAVPATGEVDCGDGWTVRRRGGAIDLMVCDGLGHGSPAAAATDAARAAFAATSGTNAPDDWLAEIDAALVGTRGAAVAIATIDRTRSIVRFIGIGNIAGWLRHEGGTARTVSYEGIVGRNIARARVVEYAYEGELLAVFSSDGLATRWDLGRYRGLVARDPITIASVLYRDFRRKRDDCTVVACRIP